MQYVAGYGSNKNGFHLRALAAALATRGIASLRFDFSGTCVLKACEHLGHVLMSQLPPRTSMRHSWAYVLFPSL